MSTNLLEQLKMSEKQNMNEGKYFFVMIEKVLSKIINGKRYPADIRYERFHSPEAAQVFGIVYIKAHPEICGWVMTEEEYSKFFRELIDMMTKDTEAEIARRYKMCSGQQI